jgi:hypothetical protein
MRVFEQRLLRGISGPKRGGVTKCMDELHNLYAPPAKSRRMRWVGYAPHMGEKKRNGNKI